ncbi:hypothetical protein CKM354_001047400 [Cercospora kikuchii]|uniref:Uncharacterized protein n=1 Tax=Cercospora kikuchii TaxID=84275 RepID=A0A9P3CRE8_9PEZI|nr:uncharacterized protein CKM354_001047400 [Cercospora kikuchii]GIZ47381.1 hypothetical protein CKM354_001047400 [Cercospora kikuchii]
MPKNRRPTTAPPVRQPTAQPPRPEADENELITIFADVANGLQECGHESNQVLHHWLQLNKQISAWDTSSSPAWLCRVRDGLYDFASQTHNEMKADRLAREESTQKDVKIRDLELEVVRLCDAAMVAEGRVAVERQAKNEALQKLQDQNIELQGSKLTLEIVSRVPSQVNLQDTRTKDAEIEDMKRRIARLEEHADTCSWARDDKVRVSGLEAELSHTSGPATAHPEDKSVSEKVPVDPLDVDLLRVFSKPDRVATEIKALYDRLSTAAYNASRGLSDLFDHDCYLSACERLYRRINRLLQPLADASDENLQRRIKLVREMEKLVEEQLAHGRDFNRVESIYDEEWEMLMDDLTRED